MKYIVVHAGRRDDYQVALALAEHNNLKFLVTDFYTPYDNIFFGRLLRQLPMSIQNKLFKRYKEGISSRRVYVSYTSVIFAFLYFITGKIRYSILKDKALGKAARKLSLKYNVPIISMNTYAKYAFDRNPIKPKILFQFHPHYNFVKKILNEELDINPLAKESLLQEYEFSVPDSISDNLSQEIHTADYLICASSLTAKSIIDDGIKEEKIKVIPYGVDTFSYSFCKKNIRTNSPFKICFIGSLNQRKGITYLLDALQDIPNVELDIIGRGIFDYNILSNYHIKFNIHKDISQKELISILHASDCFVLPSIVEGFGQVILESMATGTPVIATENTIAKDIIMDGENGFVVPIRDSEKIKEKINFLISNPELVLEIGKKGRNTAEKFSWEFFRNQLISHLKTLN